jgi:serine/threonine protein kinase
MLEMQELISGRYRLQQRLCRGGMSDVYLAYDELMHRDIAIKLVSSDNTENIQRLHSEIQAMGILSHDHILPTLDYGIHGSYHYLVTPYMRRGNLRERIAQGSLTQEEAGNILAQIASALQLAHDHHILHRDIKPSNILLDNSDEWHVYLADFGLAKLIGEGSDITQTGCLIGTPEYMAPELANSPESVSSDIYALGILLYQLLTGRPPFRGNTPLSVYWKHLREQPEPPSHINPAISHSVEQVILRALDKDPQRRFQSARAMARAYANALAGSTDGSEIIFAQATVTIYEVGSSRLPGFLRQTVPGWQQPRRNKHIASLLAIVLLVIPLSLGFLLARVSTQAPSVLSASAQLASKAVPAHISPRHVLRRTPAAHELSGIIIFAPFVHSSAQHKHEHEHERRDQNRDENDD